MKIKKFGEKDKIKILIISGSPRDKDNCPGEDGKSSQLIDIIKEYKDKDTIIDYIDLKIKHNKSIVQPCKACVSTANGAHCHYPCDCYKKNDKKTPDLMYDEDVYKRLEDCDAFIVVSPIHWFSVSSQVKAMFDRLVCVNQTITTEEAEDLMGKNRKDPDYTKPLSEKPKIKKMLKNHLEGKIAGFICYGDDGANDYNDHKDYPSTYRRDNKVENPKAAIMPLVIQCRYSAIDVPDELIEGFFVNEHVSYSKANDNFYENDKDPIKVKAVELFLKTVKYIRNK